jgi:uncharacterized protein (TIGR01777 family)
MKILVSGSSGLVGSALIPTLSGAGHEVLRLVRKKGIADSVYWDPAKGVIDATGLAGVDAAVHLAGENIAAGRWTTAQKAKIVDSRVKGTSLLADALAKLKRRPEVMVSASAIGFYGDRGDETLREDSPPGTGFLPDTSRKWEGAAEPASRAGIRVVHPRIGIVLARKGGALPKMALPFKLGVGGKIGTGRQYMSWIALDDLTAVILHCIESPHLQGPVNAVAGAVTNLEFTKALGRALKRPTLFPLPAFAARIAMGEMADELLLASTRVEAARLAASGFQFRHRNLEDTLRRILKS